MVHVVLDIVVSGVVIVLNGVIGDSCVVVDNINFVNCLISNTFWLLPPLSEGAAAEPPPPQNSGDDTWPG